MHRLIEYFYEFIIVGSLEQFNTLDSIAEFSDAGRGSLEPVSVLEEVPDERVDVVSHRIDPSAGPGQGSSLCIEQGSCEPEVDQPENHLIPNLVDEVVIGMEVVVRETKGT